MKNPIGKPKGGKKEKVREKSQVKNAEAMAAIKDRPKVAFSTPAILAASHMKKVAIIIARAATPKMAVMSTARLLRCSILFFRSFIFFCLIS